MRILPCSFILNFSAVTFTVGQLVLYANKRNDTRQGGKFNARFLGPRKIAEILENGTVRLEGLKTLLLLYFDFYKNIKK